MTPMKTLLSACALLALPTFLACGGGGGSTPPPPPATATSLVYTDPTGGSYKLVKNTASSGSHLVLDLVGPSTGTAMGISVTFTGDAKTTWVDIPAGGTTAVLMQNGLFTLGSGTPIQKAKATGNILQATVAQKAPTAEVSLNGVLLRVALDLKASQGLPQGTALTLTADNAKSQVLAGGVLTPITISVGTLKAQ